MSKEGDLQNGGISSCRNDLVGLVFFLVAPPLRSFSALTADTTPGFPAKARDVGAACVLQINMEPEKTSQKSRGFRLVPEESGVALSCFSHPPFCGPIIQKGQNIRMANLVFQQGTH